MISDTITAVATAVGRGGISVIRISGENAFKILKKIFVSKKYGKNFPYEKIPSHTIHFGHIKYKNKKIDEVLVSVFKAPKSFTGENTAEISCHGGPLVVERIMEAILSTNLARIAYQGEFTKRAFLNGKIDLIQAEAIADIIDAKNDKALEIAVNQLEGKLSDEINNIKNSLITVISEEEALIEFPEYMEDEKINTKKETIKQLRNAANRIEKLLKTFEDGKTITQGIETAIVGAPNTGKSTLLNALLGFERAIVSSLAGTTRDFLKESILIDGNIIHFIDTAGIRKSKNKIEQKGVELAKKSAQTANIILHIIDASKGLTSEDYIIAEFLKNIKNKLIITNKIDLVKKTPVFRNFEKKYKYIKNISISAKENIGIDYLKKEISKLISTKTFQKNKKETILTNIRHKNELQNALEHIQKAINTYKKTTNEILAQELKYALMRLGNLTGETTPDDILNNIFSRFCIGK